MKMMSPRVVPRRRCRRRAGSPPAHSHRRAAAVRHQRKARTIQTARLSLAPCPWVGCARSAVSLSAGRTAIGCRRSSGSAQDERGGASDDSGCAPCPIDEPQRRAGELHPTCALVSPIGCHDRQRIHRVLPIACTPGSSGARSDSETSPARRVGSARRHVPAAVAIGEVRDDASLLRQKRPSPIASTTPTRWAGRVRGGGY